MKYIRSRINQEPNMST